jgi:PRTRC genetic system protein E
VFVELMPMLVGRTVMITVAREDDKAVRVCIIPKKAKDDENPALTTPLSYTGPPEELDAELGKHLASYVECPHPTRQHPGPSQSRNGRCGQGCPR